MPDVGQLKLLSDFWLLTSKSHNSPLASLLPDIDSRNPNPEILTPKS